MFFNNDKCRRSDLAASSRLARVLVHCHWKLDGPAKIPTRPFELGHLTRMHVRILHE